MKKLISIFSLFLIIFPLFCEDQIRVGLLKSPDYIPLAYMMEKNKIINNVSVKYEECKNSDLLLSKLLSGQIDVTF
ncbi:MAG: hypothetical protein K6G09_09185, partial [Treponema sp.]|nr:hypothetical protein [Treponema sp.]